MRYLARPQGAETACVRVSALGVFLFCFVLSSDIWSQLNVFGILLFELSALIYRVERGSTVVGEQAKMLGKAGRPVAGLDTTACC